MPHERRQQTVWSLICLFGNRLLFCFMARSTLSFWWSARFIFGPVLCPFLRALRNLCQQRRCSFVSVGSEIFAQWLTGWRVAAGPCIADLTNAVQTRPGILYAVCVSVTDSLHVTVWPLSSDPRSRHVTIHLPLWHEWLSSTTDPSSSPQGAPGAVGLDRDLGSLWNRRNSHTLTFHRSITCHCCHWKFFFLLTVLRLAWVFRHFCNTLSWGKHFRSQWRI